jgi:hypothetical protein
MRAADRLEDRLDQAPHDAGAQAERAPGDATRAVGAHQPADVERGVAARRARVQPESVALRLHLAHPLAFDDPHAARLALPQQQVVQPAPVIEPLRPALHHVHGPERAAELEPTRLTAPEGCPPSSPCTSSVPR